MTQQPAANPFPPGSAPPAPYSQQPPVPQPPVPQPPVPQPPFPQQPFLQQPVPQQAFPQYVPLPPPAGRWRPERIDPLPGTGFGLVQLHVAPITSGLAIGSLIAGIASILVSFLVLCFGVAGSSAGWGGWVSGAFTLLSVIFATGGIALGIAGRRQIRNSGRVGQVRFTGRGLAVAGLSCGCTGAGIALLSLALSLVLQVTR